jgi:alpha-tubulin suppressor-like RCC1 family protein
MWAGSARPGSWALGVALAVLAIGVEEGGALIEPSNVCQDEVRTDVLFAAGAFHACSAKGTTLLSTQGPSDYKRSITCWGWGDFGQLDPPEIEHVTMLTAGARHSCAADRFKVVRCWGSNLYGQGALPRALPNMPKKYCRIGDYQGDPNSRVFGQCEDQVGESRQLPQWQ